MCSQTATLLSAGFEMLPPINDAISWPPPPEDWVDRLDVSPRGPGDPLGAQSQKSVHVWVASLQVLPEAQKELAASLAPDERERAARFHFPVHRARFIAGRGLLRKLLGNYLGIEPRSLEFSYGPQGKPTLRDSAGTLHFNVAHAEDLLLVAITRSGIVGVDVEQVRILADVEELVARFFSPTECSQFRNLPAEQKPMSFFNLWTRKEAWLKATGEGITHLLNQVEVSFLPSEPARLLRLPEVYLKTMSWSLHKLEPSPDFVGALAIANNAAAIYCWRYQHG